jgi:hypothetical protein
MTWTILPAAVNRPGVAVSLNANYQEINDTGEAGSDESQYQVFTALKVSMPVKY